MFVPSFNLPDERPGAQYSAANREALEEGESCRPRGG